MNTQVALPFFIEVLYMFQLEEILKNHSAGFKDVHVELLTSVKLAFSCICVLTFELMESK